MILNFRTCDIEATFDSDGEFVTPEAARDYLVIAARVARGVQAAQRQQQQPEGDA